MKLENKTIELEIRSVVQNAINDGRNQLNDDEANYIIRISEKLVLQYVKELENLSDD